MLTPKEYETEIVQMTHFSEKQSGINEMSQLGVGQERKNLHDTRLNDV